MTVRAEHQIRASIHASLQDVWDVLGAFDMSWNPGVERSVLIDADPLRAGSVRELRTGDGQVIRERLESYGPGPTFSYSFLGEPPLPVTSSLVTVTATQHNAGTSPRTTVIWHGVFDVADGATREMVEHVNCDIVWPATVAALAATLGVEHTLDTADHKEGSDRP